MPTYSNTHSSGSACGIQTTYFFREAREIIKEELHASADDVVLFSGAFSLTHTHTHTHAPTSLFPSPTSRACLSVTTIIAIARGDRTTAGVSAIRTDKGMLFLHAH